MGERSADADAGAVLGAEGDAADTAATSALIDDVSVASTESAPTALFEVPTLVPDKVAVVSVPMRLSASEPPPATERPFSPPAAIDSDAATDVA